MKKNNNKSKSNDVNINKSSGEIRTPVGTILFKESKSESTG